MHTDYNQQNVAIHNKYYTSPEAVYKVAFQLYSRPKIKIPSKVHNVEYTTTRASSSYMTQSANYSDSNPRSRDIGSEGE